MLVDVLSMRATFLLLCNYDSDFFILEAFWTEVVEEVGFDSAFFLFEALLAPLLLNHPRFFGSVGLVKEVTIASEEVDFHIEPKLDPLSIEFGFDPFFFSFEALSAHRFFGSIDLVKEVTIASKEVDCSFFFEALSEPKLIEVGFDPPFFSFETLLAPGFFCSVGLEIEVAITSQGEDFSFFFEALLEPKSAIMGAFAFASSEEPMLAALLVVDLGADDRP
jgi:hypothetical protein